MGVHKLWKSLLANFLFCKYSNNQGYIGYAGTDLYMNSFNWINFIKYKPSCKKNAWEFTIKHTRFCDFLFDVLVSSILIKAKFKGPLLWSDFFCAGQPPIGRQNDQKRANMREAWAADAKSITPARQLWLNRWPRGMMDGVLINYVRFGQIFHYAAPKICLSGFEWRVKWSVAL